MHATDSTLTQSETLLQRTRAWLAGPHAHWLTVPLMAFLVTRLFVVVCAYATDLVPGTATPSYARANLSAGVLSAWARWDSNWYVSIVEDGYYYIPGGESNIAFFPMYPFLMSLVTPLTGNALAAGMLVNNLMFLFGLMVFYRLVYLRLNPSDARRAVFYLAASPGSFFFTAAYTEGTYLLLTVSAAYFAWRRNWLVAAVCAAFSAVTRAQGFLVWLLVGLEWLSAHGWTLTTLHRPAAWRNLSNGIRRDFASLLPLLVIMPSVLLAYLIYLGGAYGDPFVFQKAVSSGWGEYQFSIFRPITVIVDIINRELTGPAQMHVLPGFVFLDLAVFLGILAMTIPIARRFGASYALYCLAYVILLTFGYLEGMFRYAAVLFPLYMVLAEWGRRPRLDMALRVVFLALQGFLTALFVKWLFVG
jgi:hypothetical protein